MGEEGLPHDVPSGLRKAVLVALLVVSLLLAALASSSMSANPRVASSSPGRASVGALTTPSGTYLDYVVIILMENHAICSILQGGLDGCTSGAGPYETSLALASGLATKYRDCGSPSLPNYLCLSGASTFGCKGDYLPHSNACTWTAWNATNIVDRLEAGGLTWEAFMESMPTNCDTNNSGNYVTKHDPFVYYKDIVQNPTRCARVVPAGTGDSALLNALASTSAASNYMWLTPNLCNDMHDCSVATGDAYLKGLVPQILNSTIFQTQRAALFVTFDEDSGTSGAPYLYTVWSGPAAKSGFISSNAYTGHFPLLKTLEVNWKLPALNSNDSNAANMTNFFNAGPSFYLTSNPTSVSFLAGQSATSTISLHPYEGFSGTVSLTSVSKPAGVTASFSPSSVSGTGTSTCTLKATSTGTYTLIISGTSGALSANTTVSVMVTAPLTTAFTFSPSSPAAGQTVNFTATASGGTSPYTYAWQFGDGVTATGAKVSHSYARNGTYAVNLTTKDSASGTAKVSKGVTVGSVPTLTASFTFAPSSPLAGQTVTFTASASGGVSPYQYAWQFGDGSTGSGSSSTHAYAAAGTFKVNLTVTDSGAHVVHVSHNVVVSAPALTPPQVTTQAAAGTGTTNATLEGSLVGLGSAASVVVGFTYANNSGLSGATNETVGTEVSPTGFQADILNLAANTTYFYLGWAEGDGFAKGTVQSLTTSAVPPGTRPTAAFQVQGTAGSNGWYVSNVTITGLVSDPKGPAAWILYRVDGGPWSNYSAPFQMGDGRHLVEFRAEDAYGSAPGSDQFDNISVDTVAPTIQDLQPTSVVTASNVLITWNASDVLSGVAEEKVRVEGGLIESLGSATSITLHLTDGSHLVLVIAYDAAGNSASVPLTVRVDTNPFSYSGPYAGLPTTVLIALACVGAIGFSARRRSKRRKSRP